MIRPDDGECIIRTFCCLHSLHALRLPPLRFFIGWALSVSSPWEAPEPGGGGPGPGPGPGTGPGPDKIDPNTGPLLLDLAAVVRNAEASGTGGETIGIEPETPTTPTPLRGRLKSGFSMDGPP